MTLKRIVYGLVVFVLLSGAAFQYRGIRHDIVSVVTSGTARTLTNTSTQVQRFTGSTVQTVNLPSATTLQAGMWYLLINESSTRLDVYNGASELVTTINGGSQGSPVSKRLYLTSNSTSGGPWTIDQGAAASTSGGIGSGSVINVRFGGASEISDCTSDPCTKYSGSSSCVGTVSWITTGAYSVDVTSCGFTNRPTCVASPYINGFSSQYDALVAATSSTNVNIRLRDSGGTALDSSINLICTSN